jgi:EmrB/QacA subfamily drug resistance transporter
MAVQERDDRSEAPERQTKWWILVTVGVGTFMSALDGNVVNTILPLLSRARHSGVATVEWVVTIYLVLTSGMLLTAGRWGDLHGQRPIYLTGFVVFILGSALCGLSPSAGWLIASRALQALGATMLFSSSPAIISLNFPAAQRGQALGLQGTMTYLGLCAGPLLGGWLASHFSWRAVFFINVPVGLLALCLAIRFVPTNNRLQSGSRFDVLGAALFLAGLTGLLFVLDQGHTWGWLSGRTLGLLAISAGLGVGFVILESRLHEPMLDLGLFRDRLFTAATLSAVLDFMSLSGLLFLMPFFLIQGRGDSPARAGLILTALPLVMAVAAPFSGLLSDRIGTRIPATVGMAIFTLGLLLLAGLHRHSSVGEIACFLAVAGLGTGVFISPNNSALMGAAPRERQGIASGVRATARNLGNMVGIAMTGAIFNSVTAHGGAGAGTVFRAVHTGILACGGAAALGTVTSALRGGSGQSRR